MLPKPSKKLFVIDGTRQFFKYAPYFVKESTYTLYRVLQVRFSKTGLLQMLSTYVPQTRFDLVDGIRIFSVTKIDFNFQK